VDAEEKKKKGRTVRQLVFGKREWFEKREKGSGTRRDPIIEPALQEDSDEDAPNDQLHERSIANTVRRGKEPWNHNSTLKVSPGTNRRNGQRQNGSAVLYW